MTLVKSSYYSWNPLWPHYLAAAALAVSIFSGLVRFLVWDYYDSQHCGALLNEGQWFDSDFKAWQPNGCMMHSYTSADSSRCPGSKRVVFIGDSVTRKLFFQLSHILDPSLPTAPPDDQHKHSDHSLQSNSGTYLSFIWDPFLNSSKTHNFLNSLDETGAPSTASSPPRPAMLVLGGGLWYLRYSNSSGGLPVWEAQIEDVVTTLLGALKPPADQIVILPVQPVVPWKLSPDRASSMRLSDIDAMNSDLYHRISTVYGTASRLLMPSPKPLIALPLVFNQMLDPHETDDGLHFSDAIVRAQANILLNLACNDDLPTKFPLDATCCRKYPSISGLHGLLLLVLFLWGPGTWCLSRHKGSPFYEEMTPSMIMSVSLALVFIADRTGFWLKEHKHFDPWIFSILAFSALLAGLITIKRADKDLGFLNRKQTDEWKGWMQIAILIYHYFGASKIPGIYNPIRVLVASYLFMTGYGHTTFYVKKADFGLRRVAQVLIRLNLYTLLLAYVMNTDYISYYFAPLVSSWYLIIYVTMALGSHLNDRTGFLIAKILLSMAAVTWFMREPRLLGMIFEFLERFCGIRWSAREWAFRFTLDLWIVYVGMLTALAYIKIREHRLTDHAHWPAAVKTALVLSTVALLWFFVFELSQPTKFAYNAWHPYISFVPVLAFVALRNATPALRSTSSRLFAFIGGCSLETFIIQYHFWLAGDTKGILLVLPSTQWRSLNMVITTIVFIYVSHRVADATGELTAWICGDVKTELPTAADPRRPASTSGSETTLIPNEDSLASKNDMDSAQPEPDTPARPIGRGWAERLSASDTSNQRLRVCCGCYQWRFGLMVKLGIGLVAMWVLNMLWPSS